MKIYAYPINFSRKMPNSASSITTNNFSNSHSITFSGNSGDFFKTSFGQEAEKVTRIELEKLRGQALKLGLKIKSTDTAENIARMISEAKQEEERVLNSGNQPYHSSKLEMEFTEPIEKMEARLIDRLPYGPM